MKKTNAKKVARKPAAKGKTKRRLTPAHPSRRERVPFGDLEDRLFDCQMAASVLARSLRESGNEEGAAALLARELSAIADEVSDWAIDVDRWQKEAGFADEAPDDQTGKVV